MNKHSLDSISNRHYIEEAYHDKETKKGVFKAGHSIAGEMSYYKFFYDLIGDVYGLTVLDVGCGTGWLSIKLAECGAKVYGIDISGELIKTAKANAHGVKGNFQIEFNRIALEDIKFENDFFDIVIGSAILHHTDIKVSLQNIFHAVKPRGRAIFIEPLNENPALRLWRILTPKRRSPTERALRNEDLKYIMNVFPKSKCHYFGLSSIISYGAMMYFPKSSIIKKANNFLEKFDMLLSNRINSIGPMHAVVVLELQK